MSRPPSSQASQLTLLGRPTAAVPEHPEKARLETFPNPNPNRPYRILINCPDFTSLCPITGQPDFAHLTLEYIPAQACLETKSLKLYLASYRNVGAFNEAVINQILDTLSGACRPQWMRLEGRFAARGGLSLSVIAEHHGRPASTRSPRKSRTRTRP